MTVITQDGAPDGGMPVFQSDAIISRIKTSFKVIGSNVDTICADAARLYEGRAWIAQGFDSWDALCAAKFASTVEEISAPTRKALSAALAGEGMSTRAIAAVTGASKSTIDRDLQVSRSGTPVPPDGAEPTRVTGKDGKSYARKSSKSKMVKPEEPSKPAAPVVDDGQGDAAPDGVAPVKQEPAPTGAGETNPWMLKFRAAVALAGDLETMVLTADANDADLCLARMGIIQLRDVLGDVYTLAGRRLGFSEPEPDLLPPPVRDADRAYNVIADVDRP